MGLYETIYECGCVGMWSTLCDAKFDEESVLLKCEKHKISSIYDISLRYFFSVYKKLKFVEIEKTIFEGECIKTFDPGNGRKLIRQYKIPVDNFDFSFLDENKQIIYSDLNDAPSWEIKDGNFILTTQLDVEVDSRIIRKDHSMIYLWNKQKLVPVEYLKEQEKSKIIDKENYEIFNSIKYEPHMTNETIEYYIELNNREMLKCKENNQEFSNKHNKLVQEQIDNLEKHGDILYELSNNCKTEFLKNEIEDVQNEIRLMSTKNMEFIKNLN